MPKVTGLANPFNTLLGMAANSKATFSVTGIVNAVPVGGIIRNSVGVDPSLTGITDQDLTNNNYTVNTTILSPNVDLDITGAVDNSCYIVTGNTYTFNVSNKGANATGGLPVTVNVTFPAGFTNLVNTTVDPGWILTRTGNLFSFRRTNTLASGFSYPVITITGTAASANTSSVVPANVVFGGTEANTANNNTSVTTYANSAAPATTNVTYCQGAVADPLTATGSNLKWYTFAVGGMGNTAAPIPSTATAGITTYYVSQSNGTCESPLAPIVVTVQAAISNNIVAADQTICAGTTPALLTGTVPVGGSGVYTYLWEQSVDGGTTWSAAAGNKNAVGYVPAALSVTTLYHRIVTSGACTIPNISAPVTITVQAAVTGNTITAPTVTALCGTGDPGLIIGSVPLGGSGTFVYQWQTSIDNVLFTNIPLATAISYDPGPITQTTYYRRLASSGACGVPVVSTAVKISVFPVLTPGSVAGNQVFCQSGTPAAFTELTPATGGDLNYTYQWQNSTTSAAAGFTDITGATGKTYGATVSINQTTYYRRIVSSTASGCGSQISNPIVVTVNPAIAGNTLTAPALSSFCLTGTPGVITGSVPSGGSGIYIFSWEQSTNGGTTWVPVLGATAKDFTPSVITQSVQYRRIVTSGTCTDTSPAVNFTVYALPTPALAGPDIQQCNTASFTMAANTPLIGTGVWSVVSGNAVITNTTSPITTVTVPAGQVATLVWTISNGNCASSSDQVILTNYAPPSAANAGPDILQYNSGLFIMQAVQPVTGTGVWSVKPGSTAVITDALNPNTAVTILPNTSATLVWTVSNGNCAVSTDEVVLTYTRTADIKVSKSVVTPGPFVAGQAIVYRIVATNSGPSDAVGLKILDNVPAAIIVAEITPNASGIALVTQNTSAGNAINLTADIAAGSGNSVTVDVKGTISPDYSGTLTNTAIVNSPNVPDPDGATSTVTSPVTRNPVLGLVKTGPSNVIAGDVIAYQITVSNTGTGNAIGTTIKDVIPSQVINTVWTLSKTGAAVFNGASSGTGNNISFTGDIPAGTSNTIVINVTGTVSPSATGNFSNLATATPVEPVPAVNSNTVITNISSKSGLVMLKNGPASVQAGTAITYTLKITNNGLSDAINASLTDVVPAQIKNVSWSATVLGTAAIVGSTSGTGNSVTLTGNIPTGGTNAINVTINGIVDPSFNGSISNTATATPAEPGSLASSSTATTAVSRTPVVTIVKTGPATLVAGQQITYTIEATNSSPADAKALLITDNVPAQLSNIIWTASTTGTAGIIGSGNGTGNAISITVNLPAGAGNKITIGVTGTIAASFNGTLINTATAAPAEPGTVPGTSTSTTQITRVPVLTILKTGPAAITAGQQITYTIEVANTGTADALQTILTDIIPSDIKNISWTTNSAGLASVNSGGTGTGNTLKLSANIPAGNANKVTVTINGTVDAALSGTLVNTATVTPAEPGTTAISSTATTTANRTPVVTISKTGPANLIAGQNITYTITVNNFSTSNANALIITDAVPASITNVNWSAVVTGAAILNGTTSGTTNSVSVNADLPAGAANTVTITVTGKVAASFNGTITNTATAAPGEPGTVTQTSSHTTTISKTPILSLQKTGPATLSAGQQINYILTITNTGTANADNAAISDVLPAGISNISWSAVADPAGSAVVLGTPNGTTNTINLRANIPAGAANVIRVNIQGTVSSSATGSLVNTATVTPAEPGTTMSSSTVTTTLNGRPSVSLSKTGPSEISAGQLLTYTLTATNSGPSDANNLNITDVIPSVLTNVSWTTVSTGTAAVTTGAAGNGNNLAVKGNIAAGTGNALIITITGQVPASAEISTLSNTAIATPAEPGVPPVNSNVVTTTIKKSVNIVATKSAAATISAGENITFTLKVVNNGPSDAQNLWIADQLPAGINAVSWTTAVTGTASVVSGGIGTGSLVNLRVNLPSGTTNSALVSVTGTVDPGFAGSQLTNTFTATPSEPGNPAVPSNTTTTQINKIADIQIQKTGPATAAAGQQINYTIHVSNAGPSNAANVSITDLVPAGLSNVSWIATATNGAVINSGGTGNSNTINVTAAIPSGIALVTIRVTGTINADFSGNLLNTATATPESGITDPTPAASTVTTAVSRVANVRIIKSGPADITAGGIITYSLRVINDGPSNAPGVVITDVVDPAVQGVTWTATAINGATINGTPSGTGSNISLIANIPSGTAEVNVVITGNVSSAAANGSVIPNTATANFPVNSPVTDPDPNSNSSTVTSKVNLDTDLKVSKSGPSTINIGDRIDYRIEVKNGGLSNITGAIITDNVPADIAVTNWTAAGTNGATVSGVSGGSTNSILTTGNIPAFVAGQPEAIIILNITGTVKATAGMTFTNTVTVEANGVKESSVVTAVNQSTDIYIEKSGSQSANAGSAVTYQLKVGNHGPLDVNGIIITDNIPAAITNVTWSATLNGNAALTTPASGTGNSITSTANIPAGEGNFILFNIQGNVNPAVATSTIVNTATVVLHSSGVLDFNQANNTSSVTTAIQSKSGLSVRKAGPANALSGTELTYTLTVSNAGPSNTIGSVITDNVPLDLKDVSWTAVGSNHANITSGASGTGNTVTVKADLPAGTANFVTITLKGTIDPGFAGQITNNATVTPSEAGNPPVTSDNIITQVTNKSGLSIVKSGPSTIDAGKTVQYTMQVTNTGPGNAVNAVITDILPVGLTNIRWSALATNGAIVKSTTNETSSPVSVTVDVPVGTGLVTISILADVPANTNLTSLVNTASIQPAEPGNPNVISNQVTTSIVKHVNLSLTKSAPAVLNAGEMITYSLAMTNTGPSDATAARLTDAMPAGLTNVTWTSTAAGGAIITNGATGTGNNLDLTADIPVNATVLLTATGTVNPLFKGILTNSATLTPTEPGAIPVNAVAVTTIKNRTNLIITKSGTSTSVAGQQMTYQIKVSNSGPSTAANVLITDVIPVQLTQVSWVAVASGNTVITTGANGTGNSLNVRADLPAGQGNEITINITGKVSASYGGSISNIATATPSDPDNPAVVTPPVTTVVTQNPVIGFTKTGPVTAVAGGQITYTLNANNTGLSNAANLLIADQVPVNIKNVTWTAIATGNSSVNGNTSGTGNAVGVNVNIPAGVGNEISITINGTVDPSFAGTLSNRATATPSEPGNPVITTPPVPTTVTKTPVILVSKTGQTAVVAGMAISYVIEASNTGLSDAANLVITDQINPAITGVSWTATSSGNSSINGNASGTGNTVQVNTNIPAGTGNKISITITGTVNPAFAGKIVNTATATPSEPDIPPVPSPAVETNVSKNPIVIVTKTAQSTAIAGAILTYRIEAVNTGPSDAAGLSISDAIPVQLSNVTWTSTASGTAALIAGATGTGNQLLVIGNIPAGAGNNKITILIQGTVDPAFTGKISNTAIGTVPDLNVPATVTPPVETEVGSTPGVIIKKNGPASAVAGAEVTYTITVGNTGLSNAKNLLITDQVPATLSKVSWTSSLAGNALINSGATGTGNAIVVNADLPAGVNNTVLVTVKGTVAASYNGNLANTAVATPSEPGTPAVSSTSTTLISRIPVLAIVKNGPATLSAGQAISYTIQVNNTGTADAENVVIADLVPVNINTVSWNTIAQGTAAIITGANGTGNNIGLHVNLPAGTGVLISVNGIVNSSATADLVNTATATPSENGAVAASSTVTTKLITLPSVSLVKTGPSAISAGLTVTYTLTAVNTGPSDARNLAISDAVPAGLTNVSWTSLVTGSAGVLTGGTGTGNAVLLNGNLPAGTANSIVITITGTVPASAAAGVLSNTAIATPSEPGIPAVPSNPIVTTVNHIVKIRSVKSAPSVLSAGDNINYTLQIFNDGPGDAANLVIADVIPASIKNVNWTTVTGGIANVVAHGTGTGNTVNLTVNIPAGPANTVMVMISGQIDPAFTGTAVTNTFTATPSEPGNPVVPSTPVTTIVTKTAAIQLLKTGATSAIAGSAVSYTLTVKNAGPSNAAAVNILDAIPAGINGASWTAAAQNGAVINGPSTGNGPVNLTAAIPAGAANVVVTINGTLDPAYSGSSIVNTATAVPEPGVNNPTPATSTITTNTAQVANVRVIKSGPANIGAGEMITYAIRIINDGPSTATGVVIKDELPSNLEAGATWTASGQNGATVSIANGTGDVNLTGSIPSGTGAISIIVTGKVKSSNIDGAVFTNTAIANFPAGSLITDPDLSSNTSTVPTVINNDPVLKVSKSGPSRINVGDPINYTIVVRNGGAGNITAAQIVDPVPADVLVSNWNVVAAGGAVIRGAIAGTGNLVSSVADIPADGDPNTAVTINISGVVQASAGASFTNTVTVTSNGLRTSSVVTAVNQSTDVKVVKTGPQAITAGAAIVYTIKVSNEGPVNAAGLTIKDNVPLEIGQISWSAQALGNANLTGATSGNTNAVLAMADIPVGNANYVLITINGIIKSNIPAGVLTNTATVDLPAGLSDFNIFNNTSSVNTAVSSVSGLKITKTGPQHGVSGSAITYTLSVINNGSSDANQAQITDIVPVGIHAVSWSAVSNGTAAVNSGSTGTGNTVGLNANIPAGAGNEILVTINGTIDPGYAGTILNQATVTPAEPGNPPVLSGTVSTAVVNQSGVSLVKSGASSVDAGKMISYILELTNTGPGNALNLALTDVVPAVLTHVSWNAVASAGAIIRSGAAGSGNQVTLNADLPAGSAKVTVTIKALVPAGTATGSISNTATATPSEPGNPPVISNVITTSIVSNSNLSLVKSGPSAVHSGETVSYTLTIGNTGPSDAVGAQLKDVVPAQVTNVSWTSVSGGSAIISTGTSGSGNQVALTADIPANGTVVVTVTGKVNPLFAGILTNQASLTSSDVTKPVINSQVSTTVTNLSSLQISKTGSGSAVAGQQMKYQIIVTNNGPGTAQNAVITDLVPAGLNQLSWTASVTGNAVIAAGQTGTGNNVSVIATIPAGTNDKVIIDITGTIDQSVSSSLSNTATVTPSEPGNPAVTTPPVTTTVNNNASLTLVKGGPATIRSGETMVYTLAVANSGPSNANGVQLKDVVPASITNVSWTSTVTGGAVVSTGSTGTGGTVALTANIPVNGTILVTLTGTVNPLFAGTLTNQATLTPADPAKPVVSSNTISTAVTNQTTLSITKTGAASVVAGQVMKYQIKVGNNGTGTAQNAVITDIIQSALTQVSWTATGTGNSVISAGQSGTGNNLSVTATIPPGTLNGVTIDITGTVDPAYTGQLSNSATVTPAEPGIPPVITPAVVTQVSQNTGIVITKKAPATISAGGQITYVIEVSNNGSSNAAKLAVTDNIAAEISGVTWTAVTSGNAAILTGSSGSGNTLMVSGNIAGNNSGKITITIVGKVSSSFAGTLSNTATATPSEPGNPAVTTPPAITTVTRTPALTVLKTGPSSLKSGEAITYTIEVNNTGLSDAQNVLITDVISSDISGVKWTAVATGNANILTNVTGTGNTVGITGGIPVGSGNKITVTITGIVSKSFTGNILNTAKVLSAGSLEVSSNSVETVIDMADFVIPNIITPNNDGNNDTFKIKGLENYPGTQVLIFNRWGNEVYKSSAYKNDWDGSQLNEGTYYYLINRREKSGSITVFKGWLFLKR